MKPFGKKIPATVRRKMSIILPNPPAQPTFTVRSLRGMILHPQDWRLVPEHMFGQDYFNLRTVYADWPDISTSDFPMRQGDTLNVPDGTIQNIYVTNIGSGYTTVPTVTITGDGTGATARATIQSGYVRSIVSDTPGSGYTTATVSISGGGGTGATAIADIGPTYPIAGIEPFTQSYIVIYVVVTQPPSN